MSALLGAGFIAFPNVMHAQAAPGPMRPPDESSSPDAAQPASGPTMRPEEVAVPQRKQLFGYWRLNVDESDDAHEKLKEASNDGNVASPRGGGGGGNGGGQPGGIHMGGMGSPFPGGGGGGGGSSRRNGSNGTDSELDRAQMQELLNPAGSLTVAVKDPAAAADTKGTGDEKGTSDTKGAADAKGATDAQSATASKDPNSQEIDVKDDLGRERVYYTDGRKVPKPKDEKYQEFDAYWVESYRLVAEYDGSHGARVTRSYEPAPGGRQLYETVRLERTRSYGPVEIRYVYDLAPEHRAIGTK
ncbi:MAG: hypothetical protein WAL95_14820 [Candidatus Acidiferrales bacterium]